MEEIVDRLQTIHENQLLGNLELAYKQVRELLYFSEKQKTYTEQDVDEAYDKGFIDGGYERNFKEL